MDTMIDHLLRRWFGLPPSPWVDRVLGLAGALLLASLLAYAIVRDCNHRDAQVARDAACMEPLVRSGMHPRDAFARCRRTP